MRGSSLPHGPRHEDHRTIDEGKDTSSLHELIAHLLVGLVGTIGVTDLGLEVARLLLDEVLDRKKKTCQAAHHMEIRCSTYPDTDEVSELSVWSKTCQIIDI